MKIASDLSLPLDAVTQTFGAIGRKGAGKTYLATMMAEKMLDAGAQVVAMDPVGNWFGLRIGADGKSKGKDIFVLGGDHGDVPIAPESGPRIAKLIVEKNICAVLDFNAASSLSLEDQVATLGGKVRKPLERFRDEYLASRKGYSPDTLRADRMAFDRAIAFFGKDRLLHTIRPDHVQDLRVDLLRGVAEGSVKTWFGHLSAAFSLAAELGYLRKNPFPKRRRRPYGTMHESAKEPETPRYITPEILEEIITAAADDDFGRMLRVYWMTGMRRRELVRMKWEQVGPDDLKIIGKGRKHRTFPLSPEILALLGARGKSKEYVFPRWRNADTVTRYFRRAADLAGHRDLDLHHLRHAFSTRSAMAGITPDARMALLGWSTKEMADRYTHVTQEHLREMLSLLGDTSMTQDMEMIEKTAG